METATSPRFALLSVAVYFFILWTATAIAGMVPAVNNLVYYFVVSLVISWTGLRLQGKALAGLGFIPHSLHDGLQFAGGLSAGCGMLVCTAVITLRLTHDHWAFNRDIGLMYVCIAFLMCLLSAFVQEFVFRGFPFQTLLDHYRPWIAQIVIVVPFGLMHVHSGMSGREMGIVMLTTGLGSILFGLAYLRTGALFLPVGLHLGWNFTQELVPRVAGGANRGLIIVTGGAGGYQSWMVLGPYLVVVLIAIVLLARNSGRRRPVQIPKRVSKASR